MLYLSLVRIDDTARRSPATDIVYRPRELPLWKAPDPRFLAETDDAVLRLKLTVSTRQLPRRHGGRGAYGVVIEFAPRPEALDFASERLAALFDDLADIRPRIRLYTRNVPAGEGWPERLAKASAHVCLCAMSASPETREIFEPHADALPRLADFGKALLKAGAATDVVVDPLIPVLSDSRADIEAVIAPFVTAGLRRISGTLLRVQYGWEKLWGERALKAAQIPLIRGVLERDGEGAAPKQRGLWQYRAARTPGAGERSLRPELGDDALRRLFEARVRQLEQHGALEPPRVEAHNDEGAPDDAQEYATAEGWRTPRRHVSGEGQLPLFPKS